MEMGFQNNVKADIGLRNLTIYAQWVSILGAILFYLTTFAFALYGLLAPSPINPNIQDPLYMLFRIAIWCLFPLAPLALELPQYIRQEPFFYASTATQTTYSLYSYCLALRDIIAEVGSKEEHTFFVVLSMLLLLAQIMVYASIWNHRFPPGPASRAGVNVLYLGYLMVSMVPIAFYIFSWTWAELNWFTRCVFLVRCVNASVFGIAALLYGIAWTRQHTWVSSRSLGGTGIEPMVLMMPGRGPLYQSIGNEVGEGVIRLV